MGRAKGLPSASSLRMFRFLFLVPFPAPEKIYAETCGTSHEGNDDRGSFYRPPWTYFRERLLGILERHSEVDVLLLSLATGRRSENVLGYFCHKTSSTKTINYFNLCFKQVMMDQSKPPFLARYFILSNAQIESSKISLHA